jgi:putative endonuclease
MSKQTYHVYILANPGRRLYIGVTGDLPRRLAQHRAGVASRFTRRYGILSLVHVEVAGTALEAIAREKQLKGWVRRRKVALIESCNSEWRDLMPGASLAVDVSRRADPSLRSG